MRVAITVGLMAWAIFGGGSGEQVAGSTQSSRGVEWSRFLDLLSEADWPWWLGALAVTLAGQVVAGIRWAALARPLGFDYPNRFFVRRFFEGMFFSLCLPSSIGGDVVKAVRIGSSTRLRLLAGCSVLADRLTGLSALGVLVGTAVIVRNNHLGTPAMCAVFAGLLAAVLAAFWLALAVLDRVHAALPDGSTARDFVGRLLPYRQRPSLVLLAVGWSFVVQLAGVAAVMLSARAVGETLLELPAGTLDRAEPPLATAARELAEETGYRAGRIEPAGAFWMSPGVLRERMHLFVASDLVAGEQALEPGELITPRVVPWQEAVAMCLDGRITDAKTVAGILLHDARRRSRGSRII